MNLWCTITTEFAASKITSAYLYYNGLYKSHVFCIHFYKNFLPTKLIKKCFHKELDGNLSVRAAIVCTVANFLYTSMKAYLCRIFFFTVHCTSNYLPTCKQIYPAFRPVYWRTSFLVTYFCRTRTRGQWHTLAQSRPRPGSSRSFCHYLPQCHCPFRCQFLSKLYQMFINVKVHRFIL